MTMETDFIIIGAGIAGASTAYWLAPHGRVTLLEQEAQPGYHSTGRSAAMFMEGYGNAQVRALTRASRPFFNNPPAGFSDHAVLQPRGCLVVAGPEQQHRLQEEWDILHSRCPRLQRLDAAHTLALAPVLKPEQVTGALFDPDACDLDVHALHQGYLKGARQHGAQLVCHAAVTQLQHHNGVWQVQAGDHTYTAPIVINAAGAWADTIAQLAGVTPIGLQPCRRSAFTFNAPEGADLHSLPMVQDIDEQWYFKPDAGQLLASPANVDPVHPHDVQPEEIDIATGLWHLEENTIFTVRRPNHTWAGLRSFVKDKGLVNGFDATAPGFYWVAAQGGYGIQTSAAMGMAAAALVRHQALPQVLVDEGLTVEMLSPQRLAA